MKEITKEWVDKAYSDLRSSEILLKEKLYNHCCFHSQQAVEKYLKPARAIILSHGKDPGLS